MKKPSITKVYLTEPIQSEAQALLKSHVDLAVGSLSSRREELLERVSGVDVIFNKTDPVMIDREIIDAAPRLKYIARHGSGYNNVDLEYATKKGILVSNTPNVNAVAIAEYTIGLMLMLTRNLLGAAQAARRGNPERLNYVGVELQGKTLGIIGVGRIGREVVKRAQAFNMKVLAYHPRPSAKKLTGLGLTLVGLDELLANSDIVSIHAPLTSETRYLIGARELSIMKNGAFLINMGRGGMVDENALTRALREFEIAGAALDVLEEEPVQKGHPLLTLENALVMPHMAALTHETQKRIAMTAVADIIRFAEGKLPQHIVNREAIKNAISN